MLDIIKLTKTPLIYSVSRFNLGELGDLFGEAKPTKAPRGDGTVSRSTDIFTKFNEVNLQLQGNGVNLIKAKSASFTFLSKFNAVQTKLSPS